MRKLITRAALAALSLGVAAVPLVATSATADAARPPCHDSNGRAPGGTVYVAHGVRLSCDVSPPQRLAVTRVPNRATCDDMGGRYAAAQRICWGVDY